MRFPTTTLQTTRRPPTRHGEDILRARVAAPEVQDLVHLARFLDNRFVIPGTTIRFGMDGVLELIPGIGDALSALVSIYIIHRAKDLGASEKLLNKMRWNVVIDTIAGAVPLFGDLFDVAFKSNIRNVRLLLDHLRVDANFRLHKLHSASGNTKCQPLATPTMELPSPKPLVRYRTDWGASPACEPNPETGVVGSIHCRAGLRRM